METTQSQGRLRRSWTLMKSSFNVLRLDKELVGLSLAEGALALLLLALFGLAMLGVGISTGQIQIGANMTQAEISGYLYYVPLVIFIFLLTFLGNLFGAAMIHAAFERFEGTDPTIKGSLHAVWRKRGSIARLTVLAVSIGFVLDLIRNRVPFVGKVFTWLGEAAWSVASFFALPYIVRSEEKLGPITATKQSLALVKKVWGESLVVNLGIGLIAVLGFVLYSLISVVVALALAGLSTTLAIGFAVLAVVGLLVLIAVLDVVTSIAKAAVFYWATTGKAPASFNQELLRAALTHKKARKVFSS